MRFALKCQAFIELVKKGEPTAAVALAQVSSCADGAKRRLDGGHVVEATFFGALSELLSPCFLSPRARYGVDVSYPSTSMILIVTVLCQIFQRVRVYHRVVKG